MKEGSISAIVFLSLCFILRLSRKQEYHSVVMTLSQPNSVDERSRDNVRDTEEECVVPAMISSNESELFKKATQLEQDQREPIARGEWEKERKLSEKGLETSLSLTSALSPQTLETPPPSSTQNLTTTHIVDKNVLHSTTTVMEQPVLRNKKSRRKPAPLDVDALRRERQYSGPYSANPILSKKRGHSQTSDELQKCIEPPYRPENTIQVDGRAKVQDSLQLTPHSGPISEQSQFPQIPQISAAPFVSPALARNSFPLSPYCASGIRHFDSRASSQHNATPKWSKEIKTIDKGYHHRGLPSISDRIGKPDMLSESKRERFLALCGEIWDLFDSR